MAKSIMVRDKVYERLKSVKKEYMSFSDVIEHCMNEAGIPKLPDKKRMVLPDTRTSEGRDVNDYKADKE